MFRTRRPRRDGELPPPSRAFVVFTALLYFSSMDSSSSRPSVPKVIYVFFVIGVIAFVLIESSFFESVRMLRASHVKTFTSLQSTIPIPTESERSRPTDFSEIGRLQFPVAANPIITEAALEYVDANNATTTIPVAFDQQTICVMNNWGLPCAAMSMTYDVAFAGKRVGVEGIREGAHIRMQKLRVYGSDEQAVKSQTGTTYVDWSEAVAALNTCGKVKAVFDDQSAKTARLSFWGNSDTWEALQPLQGSLIKALEDAKKIDCDLFPNLSDS